MSLTASFLIIVIVISIYAFLIEIYSVLFRITGLSKTKSKFQAISLLTSCGFTTSESEIIMNDRARRRIAIAAMITGYAFSVIIVSLLINLFFSFSVQQLNESIWLFIIAFIALLLLIITLNIPVVKNAVDKFIEITAIKLLKRGSKENVLTLLDNYGKDAIVEIYLNKIPEILYNKSLLESKVKDHYKMNFLMFNRHNKVHDVTKDTIFQKGDVLVVFGIYQNIKDLFVNEVKHVDRLLKNTNDIAQNEIDLIDNYGLDAMAEIKVNTVPTIFVDKTLFASKVKDLFKLNIMMIKRNDLPILVDKDTKVMKDDTLIVFGPYQNIKNVFLVSSNEDIKKDIDD